MTTFITMNAATAARLRGVTTPGHALDPVVLADGVTFILPLEVLNDPAHTEILANFKFGRIDTLTTRSLSRDAVKTDDTYTRIDVRDPAMQRDVQPREFVQDTTNGR